MSYFDHVNVTNLLNPHPVTGTVAVTGLSSLADTLKYLPTLDVVHYKIHQGDMFHAFSYFEDVADAGTATVLIRTSSDNNVHAGVFINAGGSCIIDIHKGTTVSGNGTPILVHNFNDTSSKTSNTGVYHTPTVTSDGLKLSESCVISGVGTGMIGGSPSFRNEYVLESGTNYLIRLTNKSGGLKDYGIEINWYEEAVAGRSSSSSSSSSGGLTSSSSTVNKSTSSLGNTTTSESSYSSIASLTSVSSASSPSSLSSTSSGTSQSSPSSASSSSTTSDLSFTSVSSPSSQSSSSSSSTVGKSTSSKSSSSSSTVNRSTSTAGKSTSSKSSSSSSTLNKSTSSESSMSSSSTMLMSTSSVAMPSSSSSSKSSSSSSSGGVSSSSSMGLSSSSSSANDYGSNFLTGGTVSAKDYYNDNPTYSPANLVDGNTTTRWSSKYSAFPQWMKYDLGAGITKIARRLYINTYYDSAGAMVKDFTVEGSNDDSSWTTIYTGQGASTYTDQLWQTFNFANSTAYRYYRVSFTSNWDRGDTAISLYEWQMMEKL